MCVQSFILWNNIQIFCKLCLHYTRPITKNRQGISVHTLKFTRTQIVNFNTPFS